MNAYLTRRSRAEQSDHQRGKYQEWLAKEQPLDYPREKDADTGSMFPAVRWLVAVVIVAAVIVAVVRGVIA